jgi:hypothetical protein
MRWIALICGLLFTITIGHAWSMDWSWIKKNVIDRIELSGSRTFGYHSHSVSGDREAFNSLNYYGYGDKQWTDVGNMSFSGQRVFGVANFRATIDTNRFSDPNAQHVSLDYDRKPYSIHLGDIQGSMLNSNRFASFQKTLKGASIEYGTGPLRVKGIYSEAKGSPRTISFTGNNTSGPFFLNSSQLVPGSEQVEVDGQPMRIVEDYVIRYEYGEITFVNRVIAPTSTIVISFEAYGFNSSRGTIQGVGATYDLGKMGRIGVTGMRQITGTNGALSTRSELFQGAGAPSTPYFLQFEPLRTHPIRVLLNGVEQTENIHYHFDIDNPTIFFFNFFVPTTATIEVIYTPTPTSTVDGDREVIGIDYSIRFGAGPSGVSVPGQVETTAKPKAAGGEIRIYQAKGSLKNEINPMSGVAKGIDVRYDWGDYRFRASTRDVPATYVSVESRGFNRNERATDATLSYERSGLTAELTGGASQVTTQRVGSGGETIFSTADLKRANASFGYNKIVGEPWRLDLTHLDSETSLGKTRLDSASLSTSRFIGSVQIRVALDTQVGSAPLTEGSSTVQKDIGLNTFKVESTYNPNKVWSFGLRAGLSNVRAGDESGTGQDYSFVSTYQPSSKLSVNLTYAKSDAGELALLSGLQTGWGLGYNGNGFSSGIGTNFEVGVTNASIVSLRTNYEATENLTFFALLDQTELTGSYSSNSKTNRYDLGVDWAASESTRFGFSINQSQTEFIDSPIRSNSTSLSANMSARPGKKWSVSSAVSYLLSGGTSDFAQDNVAFDMAVGYQINLKQRLQAMYRFGHSTGFLPQDDEGFELSHSYRLWEGVWLVSSYKYRTVVNLDGNPSGMYKSSGFDLELRIGF